MKQEDREAMARIWSCSNNSYVCRQVLSAFMPGKHFYFIFDTDTLKSTWVSDSVIDVLGYSASEMDVPMLLRIFHPDDRPIVGLIDEKIRSLAEMNGRGWLSAFNIVIDFRCRHAGGDYIRLLCQMVQPQQGLPVPNQRYGTITDISHIKKNGEPTLSLVSIDGREAITNISLLPTLSVPNPFTRREKEIVALVTQGFPSKEIAQRLFISLDTVKNHKKNIFAKARCNTSVQLLHKCITHGWTEPLKNTTATSIKK